MITRISLAILVTASVSRPVDLVAQSRTDFEIASWGLRSSIAVDTAGNLHVAWSGKNICYAVYDSIGTLLQDSIVIQQGQSHREPRLILRADVTTLVWEREQAMIWNSYIWGRLYHRATSTLSDSVQLNDSYGDAYRHKPDLSYLSDSTVIVVWGGNGPETYGFGIYGQIASESLQKIGPNLLLSDDTVQFRDNFNPRLVVDRAASLVFLTWTCGNSAGNSLRLRIFDLHMHPLGPSIVVTGDSSQLSFWSHSIALGQAGTILLAWSATADSTSDIYLARYSYTGEPLMPIDKVNTAPASSGSEAEVAADSEGKLIVAWEAESTGPIRICAQRFTADGNRLGGEFPLSSPPDSLNQLFPSVALHDNRAYASWRQGMQLAGSIFDFFNPPVSVQHHQTIPMTFVSFTNYPNPFNAQTTIRFDLPYPGDISLAIYSILGQKVVELDSGMKAAGTHTVRWDADAYPSSVYLAQLVFGGSAYIRKIALLK